MKAALNKKTFLIQVQALLGKATGEHTTQQHSEVKEVLADVIAAIYNACKHSGKGSIAICRHAKTGSVFRHRTPWTT